MSFKRSFIGVAVAMFAVAGMATSASAVVTFVTNPGAGILGGVLENGENVGFGANVTGEFVHQWDITLEGPPGDPLASNTILEVNLENTNTQLINNITGLRLALFAGTAPGGFTATGTAITPIIGPVANTPTTPGTALNSGNIMIPLFGSSLTPGDYYFQVWGMGIGNNTPGSAYIYNTPGTNTSGLGQYTVSVTATPIPAAIWLMISALLGLVSFSRIRRKVVEAA